MILNVGAASVAASAATETAIGTEIAAVTSAAAVAITGVMPMGADLDSIAFAAALNAAGASYLGAAGEHVADPVDGDGHACRFAPFAEQFTPHPVFIGQCLAIIAARNAGADLGHFHQRIP